MHLLGRALWLQGQSARSGSELNWKREGGGGGGEERIKRRRRCESPSPWLGTWTREDENWLVVNINFDYYYYCCCYYYDIALMLKN